MSPPVPRSSASVAATKVSRSNRSSAKVMAAKFPGMVGVRDEKRPFDRLGANEVVPGVSLFEQLRPFLLQHRAEQIGRATSELQSLMRTSYAVFCLKTKKNKKRA